MSTYVYAKTAGEVPFDGCLEPGAVLPLTLDDHESGGFLEATIEPDEQGQSTRVLIWRQDGEVSGDTPHEVAEGILGHIVLNRRLTRHDPICQYPPSEPQLTVHYFVRLGEMLVSTSS